MQELEPKHKIEVSDEVDQKQEIKHIGSITIPKGTKLFSFCVKTQVFEQVNTKDKHKLDPTTKTVSTKKKAQYNPNAIYVVAINEKNAARKINKILKTNRIPLQLRKKK